MTKSAGLRRMLVLLVASLTLLTATSAAQEMLTNDSVIAMKKAGLSDSLIIAKIRTSQTKFDTSTNALITLKGAGLSDGVIEAMVGHAGPSGSLPAVAAPAPAAAGPAAGRESIFHLANGRYVELKSAMSSMESNVAFFSSSSELVLKGRKAQYRVGDKQPVFYSAWAPNEVPLVKLKPGDDNDDRNLKISSGGFHPFGGTSKMGIRSQDTIDVDSEKDARGFYKLTPKKPLGPGEYGFVLTFGSVGAGKIYDFGVD